MCFHSYFLLICGLSISSLAISHGNAEVLGSTETDRMKSSTDEVRCYCNMAECITTGYMCKSNKLGCFSDLVAVSSPSSIEMVTHGCLDLLDKSLQTTCRNLPGKGDSSAQLANGAPKSLLLCCSEDMCNDVDIPENRNHLNSQVFNGSDKFVIEKAAGRTKQPAPNLTFDSDVFFRFATITVPVLGAMILFMLVTLAIKLLRSDAHEERIVAMKLRQNDAASLLLNKRHFHNCPDNMNDATHSKKIPLLHQYDRPYVPPANYLGNRINLLYPVLHSHQMEKNKTNAKLNSVLAPFNHPMNSSSNVVQPLLKINPNVHSQVNTSFNLAELPLHNNLNINHSVSNNLDQSKNDSSTLHLQTNAPSSTNDSRCTDHPTSASAVVDVDQLQVGSSVNVFGLGDVPTLGNVVEDTTTSVCVIPQVPSPIDVPSVDGQEPVESSCYVPSPSDSPTSVDVTSSQGTSADVTSSNVQFLPSNIKPSPFCVSASNVPRISTHCQSLNFSRNFPSLSAAQHPPSSFVSSIAQDVSLPTVFGPFACVTAQVATDEHPIYSLQKTSVCNGSNNVHNISCLSCNSIRNSHVNDKAYNVHGCNLCRECHVATGDRSNSSKSSSACNGGNSEDSKLNYKKDFMLPFCSNVDN